MFKYGLPDNGASPSRDSNPPVQSENQDKLILAVSTLKMTGEGFEPSPPKRTQLKCVALDHSAIPSELFTENISEYCALTTELPSEDG